MTRLLRNRWLHRALFAAVLIGLGVGIYQVQPPEPMCEMDAGKVVPLCFADDGRWLVTRLEDPGPPPRGRRALPHGPLQVWDTRTGGERMRHLTKEHALHSLAYSKDGNHCAAEIGGAEPGADQETKDAHAVVVVDIAAATVRELPLTASWRGDSSLHFSPQGDVLARFQIMDKKGLRLWDTASGELIDQRVSWGFAVWEDSIADTILHEVPNQRDLMDIEVWSVGDRKPVALLENAGPSRHAKRSADGRFVVAQRRSGEWGVWSVATGRLEAEFQTDGELLAVPTVSRDGCWLAIAYTHGAREGHLELRELTTARQVGTIPLPAGTTQRLTFSPDGKHLLLDHRYQDARRAIFMLDAPSLNVLWRRELRTFVNDVPFSTDGRTVFALSLEPLEVQCLDCVTGNVRARISIDADPGMNSIPLTVKQRSVLVPVGPRIRGFEIPDPEPIWKRWLHWLPGLNRTDSPKDAVIVFDGETCCERFRWRGIVHHSLLSQDGQMLATVHEEGERHVLRCWDLDAWKPLQWAIGVPAGLAALLVLLAMWRGRRRALAASSSGAKEIR